MRTAWATAVRNAALEDFHFHDFQHTTASYFRIDGHSLEDIGDVLGHRSLTVTRRYAHLDDSYQRKMLGSTDVAILYRPHGHKNTRSACEVCAMSKAAMQSSPAACKERAVQWAVESDQPIAQTARDLGVNENTLHTWMGK